MPKKTSNVPQEGATSGRELTGSPKRTAELAIKVTPKQRDEFLSRSEFYEIPPELLLQLFFDAILEMTEGNPPLNLPLRLQERLS